MNKRTTAELYKQMLGVKVKEAERNRSPSISLMTSEGEVLNELIKDYIRLLRKVEE